VPEIIVGASLQVRVSHINADAISAYINAETMKWREHIPISPAELLTHGNAMQSRPASVPDPQSCGETRNGIGI